MDLTKIFLIVIGVLAVVNVTLFIIHRVKKKKLEDFASKFLIDPEEKDKK